MSQAGFGNSTTENDLHEFLDVFESRLEMPMIPGELDSWIFTVRDACLQLADSLRHRIWLDHGPMLKAIREQDDDLITQTQSMSKESIALWDEYNVQKAEWKRLALRAEAFQHDEARLVDKVLAYASRGLNLVIRVRKLEAALETWYIEALNRDLGAGD